MTNEWPPLSERDFPRAPVPAEHGKMKKALLFASLFILAVSGLSAAPSDQEVADTFAGVFTVYSMVFLGGMTGMEIDGVSVDLDMETGASKTVFNDVAVGELTDMFGGMLLTMSEDMPDIPFDRLSGIFAMDMEENLAMDFTFVGGPVRTLEVETRGEDDMTLRANGKLYNHLDVEDMEMGF
jgi:hypothetical protein